MNQNENINKGNMEDKFFRLSNHRLDNVPYFINKLNKEYNSDSYIDNKYMNVAKFVRENNSLIKNDENIMMNIYRKIVPITKIIKEIITYEFLNFIPDKQIDNIDDLFKIMINELARYQCIIGGFVIEDNKWIICNNNTRFKTKHNQRSIYNSILQKSYEDKDLLWFLEHFVLHMKKFIINDIKIYINYKMIDDENNEICWVLFIIEQK